MDDGGDWARRIGCASASRARAGTVDGGASPTTFLELRAAGNADAASMLHSPYETGRFAEGPSADHAAAVCGDRGVYFADDGCGDIAFAACEEGGDAGAPRACIYLTTHTHFRADERRTAPAGHFVDHAGRCWDLVDASVALDRADASVVGESQSGRFEVTAVSGAERTTLSGSFVACRAITDVVFCE
jgi:hypothetical protein